METRVKDKIDEYYCEITVHGQFKYLRVPKDVIAELNWGSIKIVKGDRSLVLDTGRINYTLKGNRVDIRCATSFNDEVKQGSRMDLTVDDLFTGATAELRDEGCEDSIAYVTLELHVASPTAKMIIPITPV